MAHPRHSQLVRILAASCIASGHSSLFAKPALEEGQVVKYDRVRSVQNHSGFRRSRELLPYALFRARWFGEKHKVENFPAITKPWTDQRGTRIQLVVGVFSIVGSQEQPYRDVVRETWMNPRGGVCMLALGQSERCTVYVTFALGNTQGLGQDPKEEDVTILPINENMDEGKSRVWFQYAATEWTWATHIMKLDIDSFPYWFYVLHRMVQRELPCENVYGGTTMAWCGPIYMPDCACGKPKNSDFMRYNISDPECFAYGHGSMYFLSRELAANASKPGGWWDQDVTANCWPEDVATGRAIKKYGVENQICIASLDLKPRLARWHQTGPQRDYTGCPWDAARPPSLA